MLGVWIRQQRILQTACRPWILYSDTCQRMLQKRVLRLSKLLLRIDSAITREATVALLSRLRKPSCLEQWLRQTVRGHYTLVSAEHGISLHWIVRHH